MNPVQQAVLFGRSSDSRHARMSGRCGVETTNRNSLIGTHTYLTGV